MLDRIKIEGYKSIRKLELELEPINILIGSNGVGKSNFISFFKLVNNIYEQRLKQYSLKNGADNLLYFGRKNTKNIKGYLNFGNNTTTLVGGGAQLTAYDLIGQKYVKNFLSQN